MIQVEAVRIMELRGIRELQLTPQRKSFVISGPNGSGKSGGVDAIQFGLTGEISRLSGKGTGGLSVQKHGPHVDRRDDPAAAEVSLTLYFPDLDKTAVLTRNVKAAKTFSLEPEDAGVRALLEETAQHPELTLSRREIIKYILVEAGERSKEIQALLKLEAIGNIRSVLWLKTIICAIRPVRFTCAARGFARTCLQISRCRNSNCFVLRCSAQSHRRGRRNDHGASSGRRLATPAHRRGDARLRLA